MYIAKKELEWMNYKLFLENPYLRQTNARIIDKTYENDLYYLKLDRTIFFPNLSDGQPRDKGYINGIEVQDVYEENSEIIHVINEDIHSNKVDLNIDWPNRIDIMQQHTGQHLLSAGFYKLYNADTIGFHIGRKYVYLDINLPTMTSDQAKKIETYVNKVITSNFTIKAYYKKLNELEGIPIRGNPSISSAIRIVEIDSIDFSPCCGTHLRNTGEIGMIKIRRWEKHKGNTRIEFVCGNRALKDYSWKNIYVNEIATILSSSDNEILERVQSLYNQNQELKNELKKLKSRDL